MSEDPYRYCVYCNADCYVDEPEHGAPVYTLLCLGCAAKEATA